SARHQGALRDARFQVRAGVVAPRRRATCKRCSRARDRKSLRRRERMCASPTLTPVATVNDAAARIGQLLWPAVRASKGEAGLDALRPLVAEFPPGGVIVFGEGMDRVDRLIARMRLRAGTDLLVAADLERGCGQQVREFSSLPPAMAVAACP